MLMNRNTSNPCWLMSMPHTSPRHKFVYAYPSRRQVPERPPRLPSSPTTRSQSLELLGQNEQVVIPPQHEPELFPRPRSRSLGGVLDDDAPSSPEKYIKNDEANDVISDDQLDNKFLSTQDKSQSDKNDVLNDELTCCTEDSLYPVPVPRLKPRSMKITSLEDAKTSCIREFIEDDSKMMENRDDNDDDEQTDPIHDVTHTLSKAKSCGAGLDENESNSSIQYEEKGNVQGSLQSFHSDIDQKRKRNFMNKDFLYADGNL
ncbi:hypothetical protein PV326_006811 [Microctonus aethiopoides]|nr:hypothetical protein PV326_006811 [Microctonus aethiopoides]